MHMKGLGLGGLFAVVALVGCGSSGAGGTGGSTGTGGSGTTGHAGSTGTAGNGSAGHTGSGGTTGAGGAFTTSVPSGTKLTGLTSAQQTQLCNDIDNYGRAESPTICKATASITGLAAAYIDLLGNSAATTAELQAACTAASQDAGTCGPTGTCNIGSIPSSCQATVGDYTTCINQELTADLQYFDSLPSCGSITAASLSAFFATDGGASSAGPMESATCMMFDSTCSTDDGGTAAMTNMSPLRLPRMKR
jgi:hypothetical protein